MLAKQHPPIAVEKIIYKRWSLDSYKKNLDVIKKLRKTYKHYPYLYAYDQQEECEYHNAYMTAKEHLDAFVALYQDRLIGISIGCPLSHGITICSDLLNTELNAGTPYYFGDIIVDKFYWGNNIAHQLYTHHINYVRTKGFSKILALLVERDDHDLRKPTGYRMTELWNFFSFKPTNHTVSFPWKSYSSSGKIIDETNTLRAFEKVL